MSARPTKPIVIPANAKLLRIFEVARLTGAGRTTITRAIECGRLQSTLVGGIHFIAEADAIAWDKVRQREPGKPPKARRGS